MNISENKKRKLTEGKVYRFMGEEYDTLEDAEAAVESYAEDSYDDMLSEVYGEIDICGIEYDAATAFYRVDPIAYNVGLSDYSSSLYGEIEEDVAMEDDEEEGLEEESIKPIKEAPYYELSPRYDARKSFYGKAHVDTGDNNDKNRLWSYDTLVAEMKDGKPVVYGTYSVTTLRHIKDWLKQNGFKAETAKQIMQDYGVDKESLHEGWRGSDVIDMDYHGDWADPDLVYDGYTFNYWDIENALWDMFLEDTGYSDRDSGNLEVEEEFNQYVKDNAPSYLDDVIAAGYFDGDSRSWHDTYRD